MSEENILKIISNKIDDVNQEYQTILRCHKEQLQKIDLSINEGYVISEQNRAMNLVLKEIYDEIENYFKELKKEGKE